MLDYHFFLNYILFIIYSRTRNLFPLLLLSYSSSSIFICYIFGIHVLILSSYFMYLVLTEPLRSSKLLMTKKRNKKWFLWLSSRSLFSHSLQLCLDIIYVIDIIVLKYILCIIYSRTHVNYFPYYCSPPLLLFLSVTFSASMHLYSLLI